MDRIAKFLDLNTKTLSEYDRHKINTDLIGVHGRDAINIILANNGFGIGTKIGKNKYTLVYEDVILDNVCIEGDYQGMKVVKKDEPIKEKKRHIPRDAFFSPSALYEESNGD
jgi:hypothetical protein